MTALNATSLTLFIAQGTEPETYLELGGLQSHEFSIRNSAVNSSHLAASNPWEQRSEKTGFQRLNLSASGIFTDSASEIQLTQTSLANQNASLKIALGNGDALLGDFTINHYRRSATMEGAIQYQIDLTSAGEVTFLAAS